MSIINFESLLAPIPGDNPCGLLKETCGEESFIEEFSTLKYQLETARSIEKERVNVSKLSPYPVGSTSARAARIIELNGRPNDPKKDPEWRNVAVGCAAILNEKSKDIRVLCWYVEALTRLHGWQGWSESLVAVEQLLTAFGVNLHPRNGGEDLGLKHLELLNSAGFLDCIGSMPLFPGKRVCVGSRIMAGHLVGLKERSEEEYNAWAEETVTQSEIDDAFARVDLPTLQAVRDQIRNSIERLAAINQLLFSLAPKQGVSLSSLRENLIGIERWFLEAAQSRLEPLPNANDAEVVEEPVKQAHVPASGKMTTRDDALRQLKQVADFFRRTEPHSPISYALLQAITWASMDLPKLLESIIADDDTRERLFVRIGIPKDSKAEPPS